MPTRPTASKFLAFHAIIALAIATGMFGSFLGVWMRALPLHPPQQPSLGSLLLTSLPLSVVIGLLYWYLAWRVSRHLSHLVPLKPEVASPDWQRESMRRVTARMQLLSLGLLAAVGGIAIIFRSLFPDSSSTSIMFIVAFLMFPPAIVSFAYRQGVRDAQKSTITPPKNDT
jgi:hypothetical protein